MPSCSECGKYFNNPAQMRNHYNMEHGEETAKKMGEEEVEGKEYGKGAQGAHSQTGGFHMLKDDGGKFHVLKRNSRGAVEYTQHDSKEEALNEHEKVFGDEPSDTEHEERAEEE